MTRFFLPELSGETIRLGREDSHHLLRVMRAQVGDRFTVLAAGLAYEVELVEAEGAIAIGKVRSSRPAQGEPVVRITLFQGLAKGEKMESVIQHGTEVGIAEFVPVASSRSVVKLESAKAQAKVERWQRIAREAAEQSRRGAVPLVGPVSSWKAAVARAAQLDLVLVPWEEGGEPLRSVLGIGTPKSIGLFIGPEGGLSPDEVTLARAHGARTVTLGPRILRTETAGLVAVSAILYALGDLG
jgi:16S rRNA (uracil1498-N3)-methyltransferase